MEHDILTPGTLLTGQYRILEQLGSGGYAVVYRAEQINLGCRQVAIKVLHPLDVLKDRETVVERFLNEALAAARIDHPAVVMIHDVGFLDHERPFIVMQFVEGHPLDHEISSFGGMDPRRALPLFVRCLGGLERAHELGIIHRDIKPANLMLTNPDTRVEALKLIDFGIARLRYSHRHLTHASFRLGTSRYFAPEYLAHNLVTPALDVYQMGLVLVELLCGHPAVPGRNSKQCRENIRAGRLNIPTGLLDSPLSPILLKALAHDPSHRYPDGGALRDALEDIDPRSIPALMEDTGPLEMILTPVFAPQRSTDNPTEPTAPEKALVLMPEPETAPVEYLEESHEVVAETALIEIRPPSIPTLETLDISMEIIEPTATTTTTTATHAPIEPRRRSYFPYAAVVVIFLCFAAGLGLVGSGAMSSAPHLSSVSAPPVKEVEHTPEKAQNKPEPRTDPSLLIEGPPIPEVIPRYPEERDKPGKKRVAKAPRKKLRPAASKPDKAQPTPETPKKKPEEASPEKGEDPDPASLEFGIIK